MSASGLRLTIADNRYPNDSKIIVVTKEKESLDSLLKTASEKFIIKAKKLYSAEGATIDDISVLRQAACLCVRSHHDAHARCRWCFAQRQ